MISSRYAVSASSVRSNSAARIGGTKMSPTLIGIIALIALAGIALIIIGQRRSRTLREKFGPEYDHAVKSIRDRNKAESELRKREERVERLNIRPLSAADRTRFEQSWLSAQARFVDDPRGAVAEADRLVADVMRIRGYPVADFEQRAADVSVDHPNLVSDYRAAHDIARRDVKGQANTEDLRTAIVHYRALFQDLLVSDAAPAVDREVVRSEERIVADRPALSGDGDRIIPDSSTSVTGGDRIIRDDSDIRADGR
jgi:hypothetical protein